MTSHHYFTNTANNLRDVNKEKQIDRIIDTIEWDNEEDKKQFDIEIKGIADASEKRKKEFFKGN